jgi:hypothetical protein
MSPLTPGSPGTPSEQLNRSSSSGSSGSSGGGGGGSVGLSVEVHSGFLKKRRETDSFRKRWCVLRRDGTGLTYYDTKTSKEASMVIPLDGALLKRSTASPFTFEIHSPMLMKAKKGKQNKEGRLYFAAHSEQDFNEWFTALRSVRVVAFLGGVLFRSAVCCLVYWLFVLGLFGVLPFFLITLFLKTIGVWHDGEGPHQAKQPHELRQHPPPRQGDHHQSPTSQPASQPASHSILTHTLLFLFLDSYNLITSCLQLKLTLFKKKHVWWWIILLIILVISSSSSSCYFRC